MTEPHCRICDRPIIWSTVVGAYIHALMIDRTGTHQAEPRIFT
jgi:hypothetical protein